MYNQQRTLQHVIDCCNTIRPSRHDIVDVMLDRMDCFLAKPKYWWGSVLLVIFICICVCISTGYHQHCMRMV